MENQAFNITTEINNTIQRKKVPTIYFGNAIGKTLKKGELKKMFAGIVYWNDKSSKKDIHFKSMTSEYIIKLYVCLVNEYEYAPSDNIVLLCGRLLAEIRRRIMSNNLIGYVDDNRRMFPINGEDNMFSGDFQKTLEKLRKKRKKQVKIERANEIINKLKTKQGRFELFFDVSSSEFDICTMAGIITLGICPKCGYIGAVFYSMTEVSDRGEHVHYNYVCGKCKRHRNVKINNPRLKMIIGNINIAVNDKSIFDIFIKIV